MQLGVYMNGLFLGRNFVLKFQRKKKIQKKVFEMKVEGIYFSGFFWELKESLLKMKKYKGISGIFKEDGKVQKWGDGIDQK